MNTVDKYEAEALMKRLEAQFGDVALDLELLGIEQEDDENDDDNNIGISYPRPTTASNITEIDNANRKAKEQQQQQQQQQLEPTTNEQELVTNAEAAALMARLGAQFGDLDMSQLGLGVAGGVVKSNENTDRRSMHNNYSSDEESSIEEPTPEELEAWQASQFSRGKEQAKRREKSAREEKQNPKGMRNADSIQQRRRILREMTKKMTDSPEQKAKDCSSVLCLLGGDTSAFFGPSSIDILEELVSEKTDGDPEILGALSWKRLYASYEQGLGFWNLWKALKGYDGPTLLVLRCQPSASKSLRGRLYQQPNKNGGHHGVRKARTACLGFYATTPWRESSDMFGGDIADRENGDKAFLFSIDERDAPASATKTINQEQHKKSYPKRRVRFFPVEQKTGKLASSKGGYMYCQPPIDRKEGLSSKSKARAVIGLGVGGRPTQPRFHLTETLEDCSCLTYDPGRSTGDGDLFACFGNNDRNSTKHNDEQKTTIDQCPITIASTNDNRHYPDEGHPFAQALYSFDVTEIEVWGVGGKEWIDHAMFEREQSRQQHILRFQKVDKQMMWDQGVFGYTRDSGGTDQK